MKVGDKVKFKEWGDTGQLPFRPHYNEHIGKECEVIEVDGTDSTRIRVTEYLTLWIPNSAISLYEESLSDQVKDRYLNQYVFQGYTDGSINEGQFIYINEIEDGETDDGYVAYHPNRDSYGTLYKKGTFTGKTVDEEIKSRYKVGDRIRNLSSGNHIDLDDDEFLITIVPDDQKIWISYSNRPFFGRVLVYNKGEFAEVIERFQLLESLINEPSEPSNKVAPNLNDTFTDQLADEMIIPEEFLRQFPVTTDQTFENNYALAVPDDCDAIKTKRSKSLDVNIKSSKFVIPKIK